MKKIVACFFLLSVAVFSSSAQSEANYDESKVPVFVLPPLLANEDGKKVSSTQEWENDCRPEILALLADQEYGVMPAGDFSTKYEVVAVNPKSLGGKATCKQVKITFGKGYIEQPVILLMYLPNQVKGKAPLFMGYNFGGNQTVHPDPEIIPTSEAQRGAVRSRWPLEKIIAAGYGVVSIDCNQVFPDNRDGLRGSVLRLFGVNDETDLRMNTGQAMTAWAWGLSRALDYLQTDPEVDAKKVIAIGHSRLGKAALWAGAQDTRFAAVVANESGCGGAALSKRAFGETVAIITKGFPYWFCKNFNSYAGNEQSLPFDQHELLALIAPRPLYVASAEGDRWADPKGEYLSAKYASEAYELYGYKGITAEDMPPVNTPVMNRVGYHIRSGNHDITEYDWEQYLRFAKATLK
ncbi:MAG: acetylxylan esterase [Tannerellaceae bacterium]|jgi:hypothetical protein|nr:acetylxylan esterase [Tannerellaceae bacterium]